jgi:acetyl-CoA acetyltransferase
MKQNAIIAGVGMTRFGNHSGRTLSGLASEAITEALEDAGIEIGAIQAVWSGNAGASVMTGQVCVLGEVLLRRTGGGRIPVVNVENACATASTAFQQACSMVTLGAYDVVLAVGVEKLYHEDRTRAMTVYAGCSDTERPEELEAYLTGDQVPGRKVETAQRRSVFMDIYARMARDYMSVSGAEQRHFAMVSAKNSFHGSMNERAQFRDVLSAEEVLSARTISYPLTLPMCSPIGDGAAAAVIMSEKAAKTFGVSSKVRVRSSVLVSSFDGVGGSAAGMTAEAASSAYESAGILASDIDCVELHDASSPAELIYYEALGLCAPGDGVALLEDGATRLGGKVPVNPSGGLVRKGHPIGATGLAQIYELTNQLRGRAQKRQVADARIAVAENGGGWLGDDAAALVISVLGL